MLKTLKVHLAKPIASVRIVDGAGVSDGGRIGSIEDLEGRQKELSQLLSAIRGIVDNLNRFCEKMFTEHKEDIAKLSVEIARKILVQKVQEGDYQIESIVREALESAGTAQDVVVRLNPKDFAVCQKLQQEDSAGVLAGVKFVSDQSIGRAECVLETSKGMIESLINERLERVGKALEKAG